jgi:hypothetical protein
MSGASFDKAYMQGQVRAHNATVALFNKQLEDGNETHVRSYAAKYLPDIQTHTGMIHNVASNMGITVAAPKMARSKQKGCDIRECRDRSRDCRNPRITTTTR